MTVRQLIKKLQEIEKNYDGGLEVHLDTGDYNAVYVNSVWVIAGDVVISNEYPDEEE
ncbi:MAG: hypothetical protein Q4B43_09540 [Bacteroidota bacterium]|nr:hypothetical protein [Bacteroidota bacterium]